MLLKDAKLNSEKSNIRNYCESGARYVCFRLINVRCSVRDVDLYHIQNKIVT